MPAPSSTHKHTNRSRKSPAPTFCSTPTTPSIVPWGAEAFRTRRITEQTHLPLCRYSTSHWCHVMERQSFETSRSPPDE